MGKSLFITEKPSVAMEFAKALGVSRQKKTNGYVEDGDTIITWCVGHLITMSMPEKYDPDLKTWKLEQLPFMPRKYRYEVIPESAQQYKVVAGLLNRADLDAIYYSGDSAREGEYIQRLVRQCAGHNPNAREYRVWIDSQTEAEILRGVREAKPLGEYDRLSDSAYARAIEDYLVGMNFSRALSIKYAGMVSQAAGSEKYHPIAVGRVMSCVLGMIVGREREIRNHRAVAYYGIQADLGNDLKAAWKIVKGSRFYQTPQEYEGIGLTDEVPVRQLLDELSRTGNLTVRDVSKSRMSKAAPLLFNLAELQAECAKRYHISPAQTLSVAQSLYEKKLTTYPRTDARVLTTAMTRVYAENIRGLTEVAEFTPFANEILSKNMHDPEKMNRSKYVDDSKVSDHYALIPTGQTENLGGLSPLESEVYRLITRRFLSIFYPKADYEKITYSLTGCGELFVGSVTRLVNPGFLTVAGYEPDQNAELFAAAERLSGTAACTFSETSGKSKPRPRYTTGSLILAMENAGKEIEDEELREQILGSGIGTSATRASVIEKLEKNQYIRIEKKTQGISPQALGELIYEVLLAVVPSILNPAYTASWEKGLQGIVDGSVSRDTYLAKIYQYIDGGIAQMKNTDYTDTVKDAVSRLKSVYRELKDPGERAGRSSKYGTDYVCPVCGREILQNDKGYYCSGYKEGCRFNIWKNVFGKTLSDTVIRHLIDTWETDGQGGGHSAVTRKLSGFQFKNGTGEAKLRLVMAPGGKTEIKLVFK